MTSTPKANREEPTDKEFLNSVCGGSTLQEWLVRIEKADCDEPFIRKMFPKDEWKTEYLDTINERSEESVLLLIRSFLNNSVLTMKCESRYAWLLHLRENNPQSYQSAMKDPINQRTVRYLEDPYGGHPTPWEGNTWIADLLPRYPNLALQALDAYIRAHLWYLSDHQIWGHGDVETLIRAKFIGIPKAYPDAIKILRVRSA